MSQELLESRWSETKEALLEGLNGTKRNSMSVILENTKRYLKENASAGSTSSGNIATLNRVILPVIRRVMPTVIANELVGVQPMTGPVGQIHTLRVRYAQSLTDTSAAATSATSAATSASSAATSASSAAASTSAAAASATAAATSATSAAVSATAAATSATSSLASQTAAATSATSAAASATAAATSATSAANSATSAANSVATIATYASNAATSATSAATSATSAAASATAAASSATDAATTYDNFDDRYLGSKSTAPTVDNDGNTLLVGAIYWNSTLNNMYVWSGSTWVQIATTSVYTAPTLGSQTIASGTTYTNIAGLTINSTTIPSSKTLVVTTDKLSALAVTTSAELAGVISDETGTGALVFANTPTLVTPVLGVATATSINGTAIPTSATLTKTSDNLSVFAATTSLQLKNIISDETGSGSLVFGTSPTISNLTLSGTLTASSSSGTSGQVLQSTGTGVQWGTSAGETFNPLLLMGA